MLALNWLLPISMIMFFNRTKMYIGNLDFAHEFQKRPRGTSCISQEENRLFELDLGMEPRNALI